MHRLQNIHRTIFLESDLPVEMMKLWYTPFLSNLFIESARCCYLPHDQKLTELIGENEGSLGATHIAHSYYGIICLEENKEILSSVIDLHFIPWFLLYHRRSVCTFDSMFFFISSTKMDRTSASAFGSLHGRRFQTAGVIIRSLNLLYKNFSFIISCRLTPNRT